MRKTRETKEDIQKRIEEEVARRIAEDRKKQEIETKKSFIDETLRNAVYKFKYEELSFNYIIGLAKSLIDDDSFSEDEREILRFIFADHLIYIGSRGFKPEQQEMINSSRRAIVSKLRE